jgi:hypothetical protein
MAIGTAEESKPQSGSYYSSKFLLPAFPKHITYRERCAVKTPNQVDIASRESLRQADQQRVKGKLGEG